MFPKDTMQQTTMKGFVDSVMEPFNKTCSEIDILEHLGEHTSSPAMAAVARAKRDQQQYNTCSINNKNAAALSSIAMTRNKNLGHDVLSRKELKSVVAKPSEYVDGTHVIDIKQQAMLLKQYSKCNHDEKCFNTPSPTPTYPKAMARSYNNSLDTNFIRKDLNNFAMVTPHRKRINDCVLDADAKPAFDWVKAVRKECLGRFPDSSVEEKKQLVSLTRILSHMDPEDVFEDLKNVYYDSQDMDTPLSKIVDTMLCFV